MDPEGDRGILWIWFLLKATLQGSLHNGTGSAVTKEKALAWKMCCMFAPLSDRT